jgi:hypothetical protein
MLAFLILIAMILLDICRVSVVLLSPSYRCPSIWHLHTSREKLTQADQKGLSLANLGSPATYTSAVMSYPWRIYFVCRDKKNTPGEFTLCAGDKKNNFYPR